MFYNAGPTLTKEQAKTLLLNLTLSTSKDLTKAINEHKARSRPTPALQAIQQDDHLLIFSHENTTVPSVLAMNTNNRLVQITSAYESMNLRQFGSDDLVT